MTSPELIQAMAGMFTKEMSLIECENLIEAFAAKKIDDSLRNNVDSG